MFQRTPLVVLPELWRSTQALGFGLDHHLAGLTFPQDCFADNNQLSAAAINISDVAIVASTSQYNSFALPLRKQITVLPEEFDLEQIAPNPSATVQIADL